MRRHALLTRMPAPYAPLATKRSCLQIGFFATKAIEKDGEIQFDYNFERYGDKPTKCHCGAAACRCAAQT